jgi:hypothetical protein
MESVVAQAGGIALADLCRFDNPQRQPFACSFCHAA